MIFTHQSSDQNVNQALRLTLLYFLLSAAWIFATDFIVNLLFTSDDARTIVQTFKGLLFVAATTALVFWLSRRASANVASMTRAAVAEKSESLINSVMANLGEAVILVGPPNREIIGCNRAIEKILGYTEKELVGHSTAVLHDDDGTFRSFGSLVEPTLEDQGIARSEWNLKHKDGHLVPVEITIVKLNEDLGWPSSLVGIIRDLTTRKKAQAELHESEKSYRRLAENTLDVIWEMNPELVFTYVNQAIETQMGYSVSEFVGTRMKEHVLPDDLTTVEGFIRDKIQEGPNAEGVVVELDMLKKDGSSVAVEVHGRAVFDENGNPVAIQGTTRDMSHRRALEAEIRQSLKMRAVGTFASGVAHEINNPLQGITTYSQFLEEAVDAGSEAHEYSLVIQEQSKRITALIQDLLGYARVENERQLKPATLHSIVASTLSLVKTTIRHDQITLHADVSKELPSIRCRKQEIQQVIVNLVTNARDALKSKDPGPDGSKQITIVGETINLNGNEWLRLSVEDNGSGIPDDVRQNIFDPFFTTKQEGEGTGLGMWIVYRIVEAHKGEITIDTKPGEFTRINIDLPTI
ncbi:MAG: PAS domain S-box protein [Candidatus Marinimicrobia bacterium]|nr:PAS domain S-box protein [Candidatus Neomarinimicrobiota bacterium]MCF7850738.1 PAS domain S-box protein [Candidatus Neomarinimicrobiota bacterium]